MAHQSFTPRGHSRLRLAEFLMVLFPINYYRISGVSDPLLSQMLCGKASEGLFVQWEQKGHLLSLATIVWVESFSWSLSFGFAGGKLLGGELQFCLGRLSQSLHPLWPSGHPGVPWWHLLDLLWSWHELRPYIIIFCLSFVMMAVSWEQSIVL